VATESGDPSSILNLYRRVIQLRREEPALREGKYVAVNPSDPKVFAFVRTDGQDAILVVLNMSAAAQTVNLDLKAAGVATGAGAKVMLSTSSSGDRTIAADGALRLNAYSVVVAKLGR
jgi:alpha-glucosidase